MKEVVEFLYKNKFKAHVDTRDGGYYNGRIIEKTLTFIVINDRFLGKTPIAFSEIKLIERFRE